MEVNEQPEKISKDSKSEKDVIKFIKEKGRRKKLRHTPPGSPSASLKSETRINIKEFKNENNSTMIHEHSVILDGENFLKTAKIFSDPKSINLSQSNLSFINSPDDDIFDISNIGTSIDSGLDLTVSEDDKLRLLNCRLESTLQSLGTEAKNWLRERSELASEVSALKAHLASSRISCEEAIKKTENLTRELICSKKNYEIHINNLTQTINEKSIAIQHLTQSLNQTKEDHINLSLKLQKYDANTSEKTQVSQLLKKKITDLCLEINQLKSAKSNSIEIESELRQQIESLQKNKKWFSDQLNISKASQERLSLELMQMKEFLREGSLHNHKLSHENTCLQSQVICLRTNLLEAKRSMSKQLDAIKNEMVEREALFASLKKEKTNFEEILRKKIDLLKESEVIIDRLNKQINDYVQELNSVKKSHQESYESLCLIREERDKLLILISQHEAYLKEYSVIIEKSRQTEQEIQGKYDELEKKTQSNELYLSELSQEKESLSQTIQTMSEENKILKEYSDKMNKQLAELNERLEVYQSEINQKATLLIQIEANLNQLTEENETLKVSLDEKQAIIEQYEQEKRDLDEVLSSLRSENGRLSESLKQSSLDLESMKNTLVTEHENQIEKINSANMACREEITQRLQATIEEITSLKVQIDNLLVIKGNYELLLVNYDKLKLEYSDAMSNHKTEVDRLESEKKISEETLSRFERESNNRFIMQKEEIQSYCERISNLEAEIIKLNEEIVTVQCLKDAAIAESKENWESLLGQLRGELETTQASYNQVKDELKALKKQNLEKETFYKLQISEHMKALATLESRLTIIPTLEAKQKQLMNDLEVYRGKEQGLRQSYNTLLNHTSELEQKMAEKEEQIAKITHENEIKNRGILVNQSFASLTQQPLKENSDLIIQETRITTNYQSENVEIISAEYQTSSYTETKESINLSNLSQYQSSIVPGSPPDLYLLEEELKRSQLERDRTIEALNESNIKVSETLTKLTILEDAFENQKNLIAELQANNLNHLKVKNTLQTKLDESDLERKSLSNRCEELERLVEVECKKSANHENDIAQICQHHSDELQSLRKIIETATNHLKSVNRELNITREEKTRSETFLAQIRGSLIAIIEKHKSMIQIDSTLTNETISMNYEDIQVLLGDEQLSKETYLFNKPLSSINKVFQAINTEINQLETQLIDHSVIVHDSVHHWKSVEKFIAKTIGTKSVEINHSQS